MSKGGVISFKVDEELHRQFRIALATRRESAKECLQRCIEAYVLEVLGDDSKKQV